MVADHRHVFPIERANECPDKCNEQHDSEHRTKQVHQRPKAIFISKHNVISFILSGMIIAGILSCILLLSLR